ncbi:MAG TPA: hypothetical protein VKB25_15915 [Conexibacter sp.]|nr:hypothetical protein [Conexibacter sp.]
MADESPLALRLELEPVRKPSPTDAARALLSIDDAYRLADWVTQRRPGDTPTFGGDALGRIGDYATSPTRLIVERVQFGSPFEVLTQIPWGAVGTGGVWFFVVQLERLWNMPRRIRVESARLDTELEEQGRRLWEERLARVQAEELYWGSRHPRLSHQMTEPYEPAFRGMRGALHDSASEH